MAATSTDLAALYARYRGTVFGTAYYLTRNRDDAEDLVQDTFLKALTHEVPTDYPDRWLRRICRNLACTQGRRAQIIRWEPWAPGTPEGVDPQTPERALLRREAQAEAQQALAAALAPLTPLQRQALVWTLLGVPQAAIAARQERTREAIKSSVHRARQIVQAGARPRMGRRPKSQS
jgi:RNA polymerase sigma-70 factor (ECF subfamily)